MHRRDFSTASCRRRRPAAGAAAAWPPARAGRGRPVEGTRLRPAGTSRRRPAAAGKIEVIEFFWYECPHCNAFEPALEAWAKTAAGRRRASAACRSGSARSRSAPSSACSTRSRRSGLVPTLHRKVFSAIHSERTRLRTAEDIAAFALKNGADPIEFMTDLQLVRRAVEGRSRRARRPSAYKIDAVPAMGVHGRYYTNGNLANAGAATAARATACCAIVDALIAQVAQGSAGLHAPASPARAAVPDSRTNSRRRSAGPWHRMACKIHAAMRNRARRARCPCPSSISVAAALALAGTAPPWPAAPAQAREGRPLQAAERRGRPARARSTCSNQYVVFNGNVVVTKGTMTIRASRIEVRESPDGYHTAVAFGSPSQHATFRQKRDAPDEYIAGDAERLEYDGKSDVIRFVNNASVRRLRGASAGDEITGNLVTYDSGTEVFNVTGGAPATAANPGGRVRAVLTPRGGQRRRGRGARAASAARQRAAATARRASLGDKPMTPAAASARGGASPRGRSGLRKVVRLAHGRRRRPPRRRAAARSSACSARTAPARRPAST